jgi:hypothetical protein
VSVDGTDSPDVPRGTLRGTTPARTHTCSGCGKPRDRPGQAFCRICHAEYSWVTNNFLLDGFEVCAAWGFRYVTMITWAKDRVGLGQYFRGQTEHCLFAVRGSLPYKLDADGGRLQGSTLLAAGRAAHSRKPHAMYEVIERVSYGPMLEMFGRNERHAWDCWGSGEPPQRALALIGGGMDEGRTENVGQA